MAVTISLESGQGTEQPAQMNELVRSFGESLRQQGVPVTMSSDPGPTGAKSGTGSFVAQLVLQGVLSASTLTAITRVTAAYLQRQSVRKIVFEQDGRRIELAGADARDQRALVDWLAQGNGPP